MGSTSNESTTDADPKQSGSSLDTVASHEGSSNIIVSAKLTPTNYGEWAQAIRLAVGGRGKRGFLTGEATAPSDPTSPAMQQWEIDNSLVSSWLINSMTPQLRRTFMYLPTAHAIWEAVRDSYSDAQDLSHIYDLRRQTWKSAQGLRTVTDYWHELVAVWQELDLYDTDRWSSPADTAHHRKNVDTDRILLFLAGLNPEFDEVRSRILSRPTLPSPREVYSEVRREESRRHVMLKSVSESSSLVSTAPPSSSAHISTTPTSLSSNTKPKVFCDHCKKPGHSRDRCWDLHGKPPDWKPRKNKPKGYQASHDQPEPMVPTSNPNQLSQILELLQQMQTQQSGSFNATVAHKGNSALALNSFSHPSRWIVDTRASDHMTSEAPLFASYQPLTSNENIKTATGTSAPIAGTGSVQISDSLHLNSVLHVPRLACNLLSISKLTKHANCSAHFFSTHCIFQDLSSGKTIGTDEGLYYLDGSTVLTLITIFLFVSLAVLSLSTFTIHPLNLTLGLLSVSS